MREQLARLFVGIAHCAAGELEGARCPEQARIEKLEERPKLAQMVLHRRSAQSETMIAAQQANGFGRLRARVLNRLGLIENHVVEDQILEPQRVAAQGSIGGQDKVID